MGVVCYLVNELWVDRHSLSRAEERRNVEGPRRMAVLELVVRANLDTGNNNMNVAVFTKTMNAYDTAARALR